MQRKPLKRHSDERSRRSNVTGISILFVNGSAVNVGEAVVEAIGEVEISIEAHLGILDLHLHDVEVHPPEPIIVALHLGVTSTHTFQATVVAVDHMSDVVDHPQQEGQSRGLLLDLLHHRDAGAVTTTNRQDHAVDDVILPDLQPHRPEVLVEAREEEVQVVVMLELDPSHLQKPLAHVPLEETGSGDPLPSPLVALLLVPDQGALGGDLQRPHQGHVLVH